jgi:hypothetical protein
MILEIKVGSSLAFSHSSRHTFTRHCFWSFVKSRGVGGQTSRQSSAHSNFLLRSGKLHNWFKQCLWARGLLGDRLRGRVLEFCQHFMSFCWCLVALNIRHLQRTLSGPWNMNAIQKPLSGLKNFSKSLLKHFKCFSSRLSELHAKLDADTLLFCHPSQAKQTWSWKIARVKTMRFHSVVSRGRLMQ